MTYDLLTIINDDVLSTRLIYPESIDLIVTSPPYNVDIQYNSSSDNGNYNNYLLWTKQWLARCYEWLKPDGRICLNIPLDKNKGGQQSVGADITTIARNIGYGYHSTIIWNEGTISRRTAWGSWLSASAPYVIAPIEIIVVMYKHQWKKLNPGVSDISKEEFIEWTNGLWTFGGQSKKGAGGHPAAFPIELPKRCIKLFSYVHDIVLDPFLGSGTTLIATEQLNRYGIGIEIDESYCKVAEQRIKFNQKSLFEFAT
ncbi:MAG: site-specific DNA-methyltransferase [Bacteroidetes bacterium]|nr:site-specific DNA-methyltransferase [Bacteroidota bacterium]